MKIFTPMLKCALVCAMTLSSGSVWALEFVQNSLKYTVLSEENKTVSVQTNDINLVNVVIPETVTHEGVTYTVTETPARGFEKMKSLLTVDIPKTIVKFGQHTFNECSNLEKTIIHDVNAWVQIDFSNTSLANPAYKSENLYLGDKLLEDVVITVPIKQINPLTFYFVRTIKKVVLPSTVETIGKWGFYKCGVEEINLPQALTTSLEYAFQYSGLKRLEMPDNYINLKSSTFLECLNLEYVKIAKNMKTLPLFSFNKCNNLKEVEFNEGLETIKKGAFIATSLKTVNLPKSLIKIENQAFVEDMYIEEVNIGPNVNFIGYMAFYISPSTAQQFNWTTPMKSVTCEAVVPPTMETTTTGDITYNQAWNEEVYENAVLYVPSQSIEAYKAADEWKKFKTIRPIESGIEDVKADNISVSVNGGVITIIGADSPKVEVYDLSGRQVYSGNTNNVTLSGKGMYVVKCLDKAVKVML